MTNEKTPREPDDDELKEADATESEDDVDEESDSEGSGEGASEAEEETDDDPDDEPEDRLAEESHGTLADEAIAQAVDPHGVSPIKRPPWPTEPAQWVTQNLALRWLDFSLFQVERALVVAALVLMSLMIFLEMLHLALMSDESKLAEFFVNMSNKFAETPMSPEGVVTFSGWVVRIEFVLFLLLCYGAVATRLKGRSQVVKLAGAAVVFGVLYGYAEIVRSQPSELAYTLLLVATFAYAVGAWLLAPKDSAKAVELRHERFGVVVAIAAISPLLLYLFHGLPEDYSFAQHRALFLLLWVGFLGASMATYQKSHLRIDFVRKFVRGRRASRFYGAASNGLALLFTLVLFTLAYDYVFNAETGMKTIRSAEGAVPDWLKVLALPVSMAVMCLRLFFQMLEDLVLGVLNKEKS